MTVPFARRLEALTYVVCCVREHYGDEMQFANVGSLVDAVVQAYEQDDPVTGLVHGSRLLTEAQVANVWGILKGES